MRAVILPVAALLFGVTLLVVGNGLQGLLVPVRAQLEGYATISIGLIAAGYFGGFVGGCLAVPHVLKRVGHIRVFASLAAVAASAALAHVLVLHPAAWVVLRGVYGFCFAGLYMVAESWLNEKCDNERRGSVLSIYQIINFSAIVVGQAGLAVADPATFVPFALVAIFLCLSLVPVSVTTAGAPAPPVAVRLRLRRLYKLSPVGVAGCFAVGVANGAFWGLAPVFAQKLAPEVGDVALFISAAVVGGALVQWPLGRLSDRIDRRKVIVACCFGAAAAAAALSLLGGLPYPALAALAALLGGFIFPLYSLCVAHANDFASPDAFVEVSGGLLLTYGIGAIFGPLLASTTMEMVGAYGVFVLTGAVHFLLGAFAISRIRVRAPVPAAEREEFVPIPRTTQAVFQLDPRSEETPAVAKDEPESTAAR